MEYTAVAASIADADAPPPPRRPLDRAVDSAGSRVPRLMYKNLKENGGKGGAQEPEVQPRKVEPTTEILFLYSYDSCGKTFIDVARGSMSARSPSAGRHLMRCYTHLRNYSSQISSY